MHARKKVTVKGYVDRVEIALGADIVACHRRSYVRGDVVYDPMHYLSLLEKKPGALDQVAPLRGWKLDPAFDTLRRLLKARFSPRVEREYIQVLRLLKDFPERRVTAAVHDAVKRRLIRLRRRQAPAAGPHRETVGPSRPVTLPAPAPALRRRHAERRLRHPAGRWPLAMADAPRILLEHHLKRLKLPPSCGNTRNWRGSARPRDWIMSSSSPGWWSWS